MQGRDLERLRQARRKAKRVVQSLSSNEFRGSSVSVPIREALHHADRVVYWLDDLFAELGEDPWPKE